MALIALTRPIGFPIATLRDLLNKHVTLFRWKCGEDDEGGRSDTAVLDRPQMILGRGIDGEMLFVNVEHVRTPITPQTDEIVPHHVAHVWISAPTTDLDALAHRILVLVCAGLVIGQDEGAHCQLTPGKAWLDIDGMKLALAQVEGDGGFVAAQAIVASHSSVEGETPALEPQPDFTPHASARPVAFGRRVLGGFGRKGL